MLVARTLAEHMSSAEIEAAVGDLREQASLRSDPGEGSALRDVAERLSEFAGRSR
jgi:hypothetical protein